MAINWHLFQATAALIGGTIATSRQPPTPTQEEIADFADRRFVNLYRALERIAARIEAGEGEDPGQSETQT